MWKASKLTTSLACSMAALLVAISPLTGQEIAHGTEATLSCFEESRRPGAATHGCTNGAIPAEAIMLTPAEYPDAFVEGVSAGLERLAVESANEHVRTDAVSFLAASGSRAGGPGRRASGVVRRLASIYDRGAHRAFVISVMHEQEERSEAIDLVTRIAIDRDSTATRWPLPLQALDELQRMGAAGRGALQRLHQQDIVEHPVARSRLLRLAREEGWE